MANHCIDCKYCGRDRRLTDYCCEKAIEEDRKREEEHKNTIKRQMNLFKKYGIDSSADSYGLVHISARDLEKFLMTLNK